MRAPFCLVIPRGYPFLVHFKLLNICNDLLRVPIFAYETGFYPISIHYLSII